MSNLDWVFSLYAVVLGLALTEVLAGFARAIRQRRHAALGGAKEAPLGLLTPLLAIFLLFDITSFWTVAWGLREAIQATPLVLAFGLVATSLYYVAASWVFPEADEERLDLDAYYFRHKGLVFSLIFTSNAVTYLGRGWVIGSIGIPGGGLYDYLLLSLYYVLQLSGIWIKGRRANLVVLIGLLSVTLEYFSSIGWRLAQAVQ